MTSTSDGGRGGGLRVSSPSSLGLSLERLLEVAHATGELLLTCRNLKTFPAKHRCKYDLKDTVTVGKFRKEVCGFDFKALSRHDLNSFGNHSFIKNSDVLSIFCEQLLIKYALTVLTVILQLCHRHYCSD